MTKKQFQNWLQSKESLIGRWTIGVNQRVTSSYTIGYYFDEDTREYIIYTTGAVGEETSRLNYKNEDEMYAQLQGMINNLIKAKYF